MRIEVAETSLHLLLFPLPLGRGRWGLGQHSQGTPAPEILAQVLPASGLVCFGLLFPGSISRYRFCLETCNPSFIQNARGRAEQVPRLMGNLWSTNPDKVYLSRQVYLLHRIPCPTSAPSWQVSTATRMCQDATSQNTLFFILPWLRAGLKP